VIIGILGAAQESITGGTGDPYASAFVVMDFITGDYRINGVAKSLSEMVDHPEYIEVDGLRLVTDQSNPDQATESSAEVVSAVYAQDVTVIIEWLELQQYSQVTLSMRDGQSSPFVDFWIDSADELVGFYLQATGGTDKIITYTGLPVQTTAVRRAAVNISKTKFAVSVNGGAVMEDSPSASFDFTWDSITLGGFHFDADCEMDGHVRRVYLLPMVTDAELISYSAVT
jgi:hypothetical protein